MRADQTGSRGRQYRVVMRSTAGRRGKDITQAERGIGSDYGHNSSNIDRMIARTQLLASMLKCCLAVPLSDSQGQALGARVYWICSRIVCQDCEISLGDKYRAPHEYNVVIDVFSVRRSPPSSRRSLLAVDYAPRKRRARVCAHPNPRRLWYGNPLCITFR